MAMVALREIPAWQCNSTREPVFRASSAKNQRKIRFSQYDKVGKSFMNKVCKDRNGFGMAYLIIKLP